jgi:Apea-like HEPN
MTEDLHLLLRDLFHEASAAVICRAREMGLPLTLQVHRPAVWRSDDGWGISPRIYEASILDDEISLMRAAPLLGAAEIGRLFECAQQVSRLAGNHPVLSANRSGHGSLLVDSALQSDLVAVSYEENPTEWTARALLLPALKWHLSKLVNIEDAHRDAAESFAHSVLSTAADDKIHSCTQIPLAGIEIGNGEGSIVSEGSVAVRRLTAPEQSEWLADRTSLLPPMTSPPEVILEISTSGTREEQDISPKGLAESLLTAFQLHGYLLAGGTIYDRPDPAWLGGRIGTTILLPRFSGGSKTLESKDLRSIIATGQRVSRYTQNTSYSPKELAIDRFSSGAARQEMEDGLVDFTVSLEALLLPYDEETRRGELGYRFRIHGAHYLADKTSERADIAKRLGRLYGIRSALVHGGKYPDIVEVSESYLAARSFAAKGLLRALREGFPATDDFTRMVLGI